MNRKLIAYLDAVEGYVNSIARAIRNDEGLYAIAMYDEDGPFTRFIRIPSPQTAGTETQKRDYSRIKAREIVEDMKKWNPHLDYETFGNLPNEFEQDPA
jgi:hypothetical protein